MIEIEYAQGALSADELQVALVSEINELKAVPASQDLKLPAGLTVEDIQDIDVRDLEVHSKGGGFGGIGEAILITVVTILLERVIDQLIIPRIKRRLGSRAIGSRLNDSKDNQSENDSIQKNDDRE